MSLVVGACGPRRVRPADPLVTPAPSTPTVGIRACWIELSRMEASGEVGTAGPTRTKRFEGTISGLLVQHPEGTLLVDTGNSSRFEEELAGYRGMKRTFLRRGPGAAERVALPGPALSDLGVAPDALTAVVLSHAHVDHAGGLRDLPDAVPVWMAPEEIAYVKAHADGRSVGVVREHAERLAGHMVPLAFDDGPYEGFDRSQDVFGDGTVVIVPLPGHTPGSVGTFVDVGGRRLVHVGDTVLLREGVERLRHKGFLMRAFTDEDTGGVAWSVARLHALQAARADLALIPAHDRPAWSAFFGMPGCVE